MDRPLRGQCACGAVQYQVDGPLGPLVNCHCRACRRAHGAAFATSALVRTAGLNVLTGKDILRDYSNAQGSRFFCGRCAGRLFNRPASKSDVTMLLVASLDEEPTTKPVMHINVESKAPWYEILDDLPQFPGFPIRNSGVE